MNNAVLVPLFTLVTVFAVMSSAVSTREDNISLNEAKQLQSEVADSVLSFDEPDEKRSDVFRYGKRAPSVFRYGKRAPSVFRYGKRLHPLLGTDPNDALGQLWAKRIFRYGKRNSDPTELLLAGALDGLRDGTERKIYGSGSRFENAKGNLADVERDFLLLESKGEFVDREELN